MGSSTPKSSQTVTTQLSPQQNELFNQAFPYIQDYASKPIQQYGGPTLAGFTPAQEQGQQMDLQAAMSSIPGITAGAGNANALMTNPNFALNPSSNPFLMQSAQDTANVMGKQLTENELPAIRGQDQIAGGQYTGGSTRDAIAQGVATDFTNQGISNAIANMFSNQYNTGAQMLASGVGQAPGTAISQLFGGEAASGVGGQQQQQQQAAIDAAIQNFYTGQSLPFLQGQELMSTVGMLPGGGATSVGTGSTPSLSPLQTLFGGIGAAGTLGNLFGSGSGGLGGGLGTTLSGMFSGIGSGLGTIGSGIGDAFSGLGGAIGGGMSSMADFLPFLAMA